MNLVYIHIGKTAGTSLRHTLEAAGISCSPPFVQSHMGADEAARYEPFQAVCGHISRADQQRWFSDRRVITILREPIDRCLSFIHYVRGLPVEAARVAADAKRLPILDMIETEDAQTNLHNTMVRQLGGHMLDPPAELPALLEAAKETLREALWVGRTEALDLAKLGGLLGCDLVPKRENVTEGRPPLETEDPRIIASLYELNGYDLQLWHWAKHL